MIASKLSSGAAGVVFAGLLCVAAVNDGGNVWLDVGVFGASLAAV
jgi:hypothetical protein